MNAACFECLGQDFGLFRLRTNSTNRRTPLFSAIDCLLDNVYRGVIDVRLLEFAVDKPRAPNSAIEQDAKFPPKAILQLIFVDQKDKS